MDDKRWVLSEDLLKVMVKLGLPVALMQVLEVAYNLTDMFWLGRLSSTAIAAVSATWPVVFLVVAGLSGFYQAGIALVSQYWGAGRYEDALRSGGQVILFAVASGIPASIIAYATLPLLFDLVKVPAEVRPYAVDYGRIFSLGFTVFAILNSALSIYSAAGDTWTPFKIRLVGVVLNIILDPLFIFGYLGFPRLEVAGAAIATIISDLVSGVIALVHLHHGVKGEKLSLRHFKPDPGLIRKLVSIGAPLSLSSLSDAGGFTVLTGIISMMGSEALAAWGVGDRPFSIIQIIISGLLVATSTIVGQSLGAGMPSRAREAVSKSLKYILAISATGVALLILLRYQVARVFVPGDEVVVEYAAGFTLYMGPSIVFLQLFSLASSVANGSGHTKPLTSSPP